MRTSLFRLMAVAMMASTLFAQSAALRIVVIAGEDATNVIQQRTAVAPIVEVRDRNDNPVAGALVTFVINRRATFPDQGRTLTVTTDAAGRAEAAGIVPQQRGAVEIQVRATYQGNTSTATITQVNVASAPTSATGAAGAAGTTGGAAAGGISALTIGAVAGGAGAAVGTAVLLRDDAGPGASGGSETLLSLPATFTGTISVPMTDTLSGTRVIASPCTITHTLAGTVTVTLTSRSGADYSGNVGSTLTFFGGTNGCTFNGGGGVGPQVEPRVFGGVGTPFLGPVTALFGEARIPGSGALVTSVGPLDWLNNTINTFRGALNNGVVTGTLTHSTAYVGVDGTWRLDRLATAPVSLR